MGVSAGVDWVDLFGNALTGALTYDSAGTDTLPFAQLTQGCFEVASAEEVAEVLAAVGAGQSGHGRSVLGALFSVPPGGVTRISTPVVPLGSVTSPFAIVTLGVPM